MNACRVIVTLSLVHGLCLAEPGDAAQAMALAAEGARAAEAGELATYLEKMEGAVALRPDFPQLLMNLAAAHVANDRPEDAVATLERAVALGVTASLGKAEEFAPLRGRKEFDALVRKFADNGHPQGRGEIAFSLRDVTGLIEGIAWREKTSEFFFGDVNARAIWRRNKDNTLRRFTPDNDDLLGVFGLAVDENAGVLWAATSAVAAMSGFTPEHAGSAALAEIDLESGAVRRVIPLEPTADRPSNLLGGATVAPDGTVYVTGSPGAAIWRLAPGAEVLELFAESGDLLSPQGIVAVADGSVLLVADRINGLLRIGVPDGGVRRFEPPADSTLVGIDGLAAAPNGAVIAIQAATSPKRVLRITLDGAAESVTDVAVLESGHLTMAAPASGCIAQDGDFFFIGNSGRSRFGSSGAEPTAPRRVPVFKTKLPGGR